MRTHGFRFRYAGFIPLLLLLAAHPTWADGGITKGESVEGITEYRLDNGVQVLLYPDASKPTVTVNLTVFVGSRHEGYGETGMAHFLEHMLFKGTPTHTDIPRLMKERGARFNGTTWVDRTNYYETVPAKDDNLEYAIRLEADRLLNSHVRREDLLSEMTVVRNEFERGENSPEQILSQRIYATAFEWHNYGKSTIGNRSDIERVPIENLRAFYRKFYQPDNIMLAVAGKFEEKQALELIAKYFGKLPKPDRKLSNTYTEEPTQDGERTVILRRVGDVGMVGAAYHVPAGSHPDVVSLEILANILDATPSGRLYKALVESHKASGVQASVTSFHDPGLFEVMASVRKEDSLEKARDTLIEVTEKVGEEGVTDEEVKRAIVKLLKQREMAAADTSTIAVQLSEWAAQGDWRLYFLHRDRLEKVTAKDVQEVAKKYLKLSNRTVGMFIPSDKIDRASVPPTPDLVEVFKGYQGRKEVAAGESFDVSPANIEARSTRSTLTSGIKAVLLPKKTRGETVNVRLVLRYGTPETLKGHETAAEMLPSLLMRGTKQLSRQQIQDELDKNQAVMIAAGDTGTVTVTIETKRANLPAVLNLLRQILREPSFPASEFDIYRRQQLAGLEEQLTDPQALGITQLRRTVSPYAKGDVRYIPTLKEEIDRVGSATIEQVQKVYNEFLNAQNGELAIVGDFDPAATTKAVEEALSGWTSKQTYARIPRLYFPDVAGGKHEIQTPDKPNAVYMAGLAFAVKDDDPDYPAVLVGNYAFGGGALSSRLGDRVRQKEGLSYGVGSFIAAESLDRRGSLTIFAICNPQNMPKVNSAIKEELDKLIAAGVTAEELERSKRGYLEQQQVARTRDSFLASTLSDTAYVGRNMSYYLDLEKKILALSTDDVHKALKKHVDPTKLVIVNAGDLRPSQAEKKAGATK